MAEIFFKTEKPHDFNMASYRLVTIEFEEEADAEIDNFPQRWRDKVRSHKKNRNYLSVLLYQDYPWNDELAEGLAEDGSKINRFTLCSCNDTNDMADFTLYEITGVTAEKIEYVSDREISDCENGTCGKPSRKYLKDEYDFDAWGIWQFWDAEENNQ